jgi:TonB-linked SusC/RagA family outer membrane protein
MSNFRWLLAVLIAVAAIPVGVDAQQTGTITGRVTAQEDGRPLASTQIAIPGTTLRTVTGPDGTFRLPNVPAGQYTVNATFIGRGSAAQQVTVAVGQTANVVFRLGSTAVALEEIVVTGTAGNQERRAQPAVVASINAAQLAQTAPVTTVSEVLGGGRVAGISVVQASGSAGTAQQIRIRGASSISLSNEPIVFIDGVRADSRLQGGGVGRGVGGQGTSRLNDVNPDDIESIEVVKGPAAATLYGADASAGVIQIITKRGRAGSGAFSQSITAEYANIDPNFTPPDNFQFCRAADTARVSTAAGFSANPLCAGQPVGTLVSDNPLVREGAFRNGRLRSFNYNGRGGGESYGYFISAGNENEAGTLPGNQFDRRSGRVNFNFIPSEKVSVDAGFALLRTFTSLPQNDNNGFGFLGGGLLGNPQTRREDGAGNNGFFAFNRNVETIPTVRTESITTRNQPSITARYTPFNWFTNRFTVGADQTRTEFLQFFPRDPERQPFGAALAVGDVFEQRQNFDVITFDYLGNLRRSFGANLDGDLSFGLQAIDTRNEGVFASGRGLSTNEARVVSAAATRSGGQFFSQVRQIGYLMQGQLGFRDKLFVQLGARVDRNSSFGAESDAFFLPKAGVSYVLSQEPFWQDNLSFVNTFRVRAAYGETGRSPSAGASLQTFEPSPFVTTAATSLPGVIPLSPGNFGLRAERGKELEAGFDAGFLQDRMGLELTYFNKRTSDLLLRRPLPPSLGFTENPFFNLGGMVNRGVEFALRGQVISTPNFSWDARVSGNTLHNEITSLGAADDGTVIQPFGTLQRFTPGRQVAGFHSLKIRSVDVENNRVIVSDTIEFIANSLPTREGAFSSEFTLFRNLRINGLLDYKGGHAVYNNTDFFRETQFLRSDNRLDPTKLSAEERLRRYGDQTPGRPSFIRENGTTATVNNVNEAYIQNADFVKLRELGATLSLPQAFASRFGASGASFTLAGRNLKTWTDYEGFDPEVISGGFVSQFDRTDFLTVPPARRLVARVNFQF